MSPFASRASTPRHPAVALDSAARATPEQPGRRAQRRQQQRGARAEERADSLNGSLSCAPASSSNASRASVAVAIGHFHASRPDIGSWELDSWELSRVPMSRLRSEMRLNARSVHQMQPIAATTPPIAPPTSDAGDTCSVSAVVPTASTHHDRSPYIISHA